MDRQALVGTASVVMAGDDSAPAHLGYPVVEILDDVEEGMVSIDIDEVEGFVGNVSSGVDGGFANDRAVVRSESLLSFAEESI